MNAFHLIVCKALATLAFAWGAVSAAAAIPISGRPVPSMAPFDTVMTSFMEQYNVEAGLLGIMNNDRIVYLRGFGYLDPDTSTVMPETALVRQASSIKPATAAAIRRLADAGAFGAQGIDRCAFNVTVNNVNNNGLLNIAPWPSLGDTKIKDITIRHLLTHTGGFNRNSPLDRNNNAVPGDTPLIPRTIAAAMGISSPPSRTNIIRYTLGFPLNFTPGTDPGTIPSGDKYSNFGYLVLGEIIAQAHAGGYVDCLHDRVFQSHMWVPRSEMRVGFTLRDNRDPREPWYRVNRTGPDIFDNSANPPQTNWEYGGLYSLSNMMAHGGLIASAPAMLQLGNNYLLGYPDIGTPETEDAASSHSGLLWGLQTKIRRRSSDGVVFYFFINKAFINGQNGALVPISDLETSINSLLSAGSGSTWTWPTTTSDGFWVTLTSALPDTTPGGYHSSWRGFGNAMAKVEDRTRLRLRPGSSTWTGTIRKRLLIDAPLGPAVIGQ